MFYLYEKFPGQTQMTLAAVMIAYVDDFLLTHDDRFDRSKLTGLFTWGSQDELSLEHPLDFNGKQIALRYDIAKKQFSLCLNQTKFIESIKPGKVDKKRLKETIDASDMPEFRSGAGCWSDETRHCFSGFFVQQGHKINVCRSSVDVFSS